MYWIVLDFMHFFGQIPVKGTEGRYFTGTGAGAVSSGGRSTFVIFGEIVTGKTEKIVKIGQCNAGNQIQIHAIDRNLFKRCIGRHQLALAQQKTEKCTKIQKIFLAGAA